MLHVVRYREGELASVVASINATGYGLTHGIQTRIDETVEAVCKRIRAGNIYVNRNMMGAVVGVQPFCRADPSRANGGIQRAFPAPARPRRLHRH